VGLLAGEFGRCELATDMGEGTWTIAVPALGDCLPRSTARTGGHRRKPTVMAKIV
jgi:actin-like ATPase involved in cell morphogenesis